MAETNSRFYVLSEEEDKDTTDPVIATVSTDAAAEGIDADIVETERTDEKKPVHNEAAAYVIYDDPRSALPPNDVLEPNVVLPKEKVKRLVTLAVMVEDMKALLLNRIIDANGVNDEFHAGDIQDGMAGVYYRKSALRAIIHELLMCGFLIEGEYGVYRVNLKQT